MPDARVSGPRVSARACILREGHVLLAKCHDDRGFWYMLPGGGQRRGETLDECLVREVREEIGAMVEVGPLLYVREIIADRHRETWLPPGFHQVELFFACSLLPEGEPDPAAADDLDLDQVGHEWLPLERLSEVLFFPRAIADRIADPSLTGYLGEIR